MSERVTFPGAADHGPVVDIVNAIDAHPAVIVAGETGSGKTTQLPKICLRWAGRERADRLHAAAAHRSHQRRGPRGEEPTPSWGRRRLQGALHRRSSARRT
jgi:ATP-dependent helicase HrpA